MGATTTPPQEDRPPDEQPEGIDLTLEQRVTRMEVEVGDLWEHLRRWSARQAARARRDIEAAEGDTNGAVSVSVPVVQPNGAPVGIRPGSKAWRDYQKSLIRERGS